MLLSQPLHIVYSLFLISCITNFISRDRKILNIYLLPALISFLLLLLLNNFSVDVEAYKRFFDWLNPYRFWELRTDIGYSFLMSLFKITNVGFYPFLACINLLALVVIDKLFRKYSPYIALSWLWYIGLFSGYNHTILRQGIALMFVLCALTMILNRQLLLYLLFLVLAVTMHSSAIFFLPAYWIANVDWKERYVYVAILCASPLIFIDFASVLEWLAYKVGMYGPVVVAYFNPNGENYVKGGLSFGLLVRMLMYIFYALSYEKSDRWQCIIFRLYSFYLILYFPLCSVGMLSARGLDYYKIIECFMIPITLYNIRNVYIKYGLLIFIVLYTFLHTYKTSSTFINGQSSLLKMILDCII